MEPVFYVPASPKESAGLGEVLCSLGNQMGKIIEILCTPSKERWPTIHQQPDYVQLQGFKPSPPQLDAWYSQTGATNKLRFELLQGLLEYDPVKRLTASQALEHKYFSEGAKLSLNAFEPAAGVAPIEYPHRRVSQEDNDISQPVRCGFGWEGEEWMGVLCETDVERIGVCGNFCGNVDGVKFLVLAWFHSVGV